MKVLGIETSCDETSVAIVDVAARDVIAETTYTQVQEHFDYGGVVPEIASRAHLERLPGLLEQTLTSARMPLAEVDAVAATVGPGLVGALLVGATFGRSLAWGLQKPFVAVNHLEGHALSPFLGEGKLDFPYLLLLISGGHCQLVQVEALGQYKTLGATRDDAAGECLDKSARLLGLQPASGKAIEDAAKRGDPFAVDLPQPQVPGLDFSFSGLKTAVAQRVLAMETLSAQDVANFAAALQRTVASHLAYKAEEALKETRLKTLVAAGGVAANTEVRTLLETVAVRHGARLVVPPLALCTDNAAMIAYAGGLRLAGQEAGLDAPVQPRWPLDEMSTIR
jgi:N6-L-threonylcarbamoyladenine synthase